MFVIVVYDVNVKRVNRINKILKKYLFWIQNSVFEGELTKSLYYKMENELKTFVKDEDFIRIYKVWNEKQIEKKDFGSSLKDMRML